MVGVKRGSYITTKRYGCNEKTWSSSSSGRKNEPKGVEAALVVKC